ncbi:GNAT family N-acetyltransferase [Ureibacillus acetophenoni]|uniref:Acetyltransferase (GNAT) family protein n=1 Tax=Ureibacillus acetophenoni TaxID=614649 RepID=A0A285UD68_9BACL|nr:GNAT family N-acetyltransferase [Ureibacillus acetophenoni]SOC39874.1 acetyltransferase (GNAT) family protein [Ureibacillus acetophenoni]
MVLSKATDFEELAQFLSTENKEITSHIGYCGEKVEEIYQTLKEDFIDENGEPDFLIARNDSGEIVAAIGIDADETSGEVWGPFNQTTSYELQHELFEKLLTSHPHIQTFQFFNNKENTMQCTYMDKISASKTGEHLILIVQSENFEGVQKFKSTSFQQSDFLAFQQLHKELFPNTYYDAAIIVGRISEHHVLKILKNEFDEVLGYAYYEVDPAMGEASLEYIGISSNAQNKGLGTLLLREVLTEMFSYSQISEIQLCVDNTNSQANHVYFKVGFETKYVLVSYEMNRS